MLPYLIISVTHRIHMQKMGSLFRSLPSLALSRCLCRSRAIRDCSYRLTGATGILLFYSTLDASKKKTVSAILKIPTQTDIA